MAGYVGGNAIFDSRAVALADLWNRGVLDVVVANQNDRLMVYKNSVRPEHNWIGFRLEGTRSNRSAIGATVTLHWGGNTQSQIVSGGIGYCSQNQRRVQFGLGDSEQVEKAVIHWPSGNRQQISRPEAGKVHLVREPQ